jgi:choline kinase
MLESLGRNGVRDTIIVTGHQRNAMRHFLRTVPPGMRVTEVFNPLYVSTQNNYSLWLALRECPDREILLLDGDILFAPQVLTRLMQTRHQNALILKVDPDPGEEEMKITCQPDGRVTAIGKHLAPGVSAGESLGLEKFSSGWTEMLLDVLDERKTKREFYEASFQTLIDRGLPLYAVSSSPHECIEIDTPADLEAAELIAQRING